MRFLWPSAAFIWRELFSCHSTSQVVPVSPAFQKPTAEKKFEKTEFLSNEKLQHLSQPYCYYLCRFSKIGLIYTQNDSNFLLIGELRN